MKKRLFRVRDKEYNDYYVWAESLDCAEKLARDQHDAESKVEVATDGTLNTPEPFVMREIEVLSDRILTQKNN